MYACWPLHTLDSKPRQTATTPRQIARSGALFPAESTRTTSLVQCFERDLGECRARGRAFGNIEAATQNVYTYGVFRRVPPDR
jgi:hypothetical protein